ncbi:MAG: choice-of-anchor Q domain-containing protein [Pirellulales bacterium]
MLAITVDTLVDEADGSIDDGDVSLRDAIALAAVGEQIDFSVTGIMTLTLGELVIDKALTVSGPGANLLTVDASGNDPTPEENNGDGSRVFRVDDGLEDQQIDVRIAGLTVTGGDAPGAVGGGALFNRENLTLAESIFTGNATGFLGGGIYNDATGVLSLETSTVSNNSAGGFGGGVFNQGVVSITSSTLSMNSAEFGGGLFNNTVGTTTITSTTMSSNVAISSGGGIHTRGILQVRSSTMSGNSAPSGGGIFNTSAGVLTVVHSTIALNSADNFGGGIFNAGTAAIHGSLIAQNNVDSSPDILGEVIGEYNLIGDGTGMSGLVDGSNGNQVGSGVSPIDPLLGPLQDNGGPTFTHSLLSGSPAIDKGDPGLNPPPYYLDQRAYVRVVDGDGDEEARADVGAVEFKSIPLPGDGNQDGKADGLDYLIWAEAFGDDPAQVPPGSPQNGDYNDDGVVDGVDYLLWANYFEASNPPIPSAVVSAEPASATGTDHLAGLDLALEADYDAGAMVADDQVARDWQLGRAFDSVLKNMVGKRHGLK